MDMPPTVLINYASIDNLAGGGGEGWVTNFKNALELRLSQLSHHPIQLVMAENEEPDGYDAVITIRSPNHPPEEGQQKPGELTVFKTFVSHQVHRTTLDTFRGYLFYRLDVDTGAVEPLHVGSLGEDGSCYWSRLDDLARDLLAQLLQIEGASRFSYLLRDSKAKTVFVAHVSEDLWEQRDEVVRELKQLGHEVVPKNMDLLNEEAFLEQTAQLISSCQFSVHLVGKRYGVGPGQSKNSMMELELQAASERCGSHSLKSLIWIKPNLTVEDMRQKRFLDAAWEASAHGCADIYEGALVEFKEVLFARLNQTIPEVEPLEQVSEQQKILLVGHPHERAEVEGLAQEMQTIIPQGDLVLSVGRDENNYHFHQDALIAAHAVLFVLPEGDDDWLKVHLLELQKAVGYGRQTPLKALAIFYKGVRPQTAFSFLGREIMMLSGDLGVSEEALQPFLEQLQDGEPVPIRPPSSFNPFPGLRSFQSNEKHLFFAREKEISSLLKILEKNRFLALIGPSGSGKSSLVRSGLIPALQAGHLAHAGSSWRMAGLNPGDSPIHNLTKSLVKAGMNPSESANPLSLSLANAVLRRGALGLADFVADSGLTRDGNLLILVDQFEELFRFEKEQRQGREEALAFSRLLLLAAQQKQAPIYIIMTMRSDFLEYCADFPGLIEAINRNTFLVPRMNRTQRSQAIKGPVAVGGGHISKRLVNQLINDMGEHSDPLPVLQHALMRAWSYWETHHDQNEPMDLEHYQAVGGMKEALSRHAEEAYRDLEDGRLRFCAEKVFETLTYMGQGGRGMRRPSRIDELAEIGGIEIEEVKAVVECFRGPGRSFLRPSISHTLQADTVVDISHESLMRVWTRLADWGDAEMRAARIYKRLVISASRYHEGLSGLWRDPELQTALRWKEEFKPTPAWGVRYDPTYERAMLFLETSRQARDDDIVRKEKEQRRQLLLRRNIAIAMGLLALLAVAFFLTAHFRGVKVKSNDLESADKEAAFGFVLPPHPSRHPPNPAHSASHWEVPNHIT